MYSSLVVHNIIFCGGQCAHMLVAAVPVLYINVHSQAALTGESLAVTMTEGDEPKMGSTVVRGEVEATVMFTGKDSFFGKTAAMLSGPEETSNLQKLLIKIMGILVVLSVSTPSSF